MSKQLFDGSDEEININVNNSYAQSYDNWRGKEEYEKLKAKHGDMADSGSEESSSSDDEDAEEITPALERQFFRTLSHLKQGSDDIYDAKVQFFRESSPTQAAPKSKTAKPVLLRDYERNKLLSAGGVSDEEEAVAPVNEDPSYVEEMESIKKEFHTVLRQQDGDDSDGEDSDLLTKRQKSAAEQEKEEEDYKQWLVGRKKDTREEDLKHDLQGLQRAWSDPKINKDEAFLRDYILNKRYLEEGDDTYIPHYEELVRDSDEPDLSDDERTLQNQAEFEHKFNFRFQEPDQEFIKKYPRTIKESLRKKDERRKKNREEKRQRLADDKLRRQEEIKRLKAFKRKEVMEKLEKLKETVGHDQLPFELDDLEQDFDPEVHERQMKQMFSENYDFEGDADEEKPEFSDDDNDTEYWNSWQPGVSENGEEECEGEGVLAPACEDPSFNMDCDYDPRADHQRELLETSRSTRDGKKLRRRRGQKRPLAAVLARAKPAFDPLTMQLDRYVEEHYRLHELDMPLPFKYRTVMANDYGLSPEEMLAADERELNRWVSLRRTVQYRREEEELSDLKRYKVKARNIEYKQKILPSLYQQDDEEDTSTSKTTKKKNKNKQSPDENGDLDPPSSSQLDGETPDKASNKKKRCSDENGDIELPTLPQPGVESSGSKKSKKRNYSVSNGDLNLIASQPDGETPDDRGSRKKKQSSNDNGDVELPSSSQPNEYTLHSKKSRKKRRSIGNNGEANDQDQQGRVDDPRAELGAEKAGASHGDGAQSSRPLPREEDRPTAGSGAVKHRKMARIADGSSVHTAPPGGKKQKQAKRREMTKEERAVGNMSDARLQAFGLNPKKFRNKLKYGQKCS